MRGVIIGMLVTGLLLFMLGCGKSPAASNPTQVVVDNPLSKALKSGMPVLADFGRGTCIPCKMMKPILEELMQTYEGRAEIFIFDIDEYRDLTKECKINLIPTQILFDKTGKEVWRHEGFLEKQKIIEKLKELGVN